MINSTHQETDSHLRERCLMQYIDAINSEVFIADKDVPLFTSDAYASLRPLFASIFCVPATSAPVERVFSQSGLITRPRRAKMSDTRLESLFFFFFLMQRRSVVCIVAYIVGYMDDERHTLTLYKKIARQIRQCVKPYVAETMLCRPGL
jgi:hypothetical protein